MGILHVVCGGQFGSEAKGHVTGWLSKSPHIGAVVRVAGPNAGHTAYDAEGARWSLRQVPVAAVTNPDCNLYIAAGSEIDPRVLAHEVASLDAFNVSTRLFVDPEATIIEPNHSTAESVELVERIGSTGKGIGRARSDRINRVARTWSQFQKEDFQGYDLSEAQRQALALNTAPCAPAISYHLSNGKDVVIEGTQGYGLGLHAGYYPFCTSSDCRAIDFLAMAGANPWLDIPQRKMDGVFNFEVSLQVWVVFRTYPIRVAGNSGPMFQELDWSDLAEQTAGHIQPERTTVTQKIRRIGSWDERLAQQAMRANGWPSDRIRPVLTFLDYVFPELANVDDQDVIHAHEGLWKYIQEIESSLGGGERAPLAAITTGPNSLISLL